MCIQNGKISLLFLKTSHTPLVSVSPNPSTDKNSPKRTARISKLIILNDELYFIGNYRFIDIQSQALKALWIEYSNGVLFIHMTHEPDTHWMYVTSHEYQIKQRKRNKKTCEGEIIHSGQISCDAVIVNIRFLLTPCGAIWFTQINASN